MKKLLLTSLSIVTLFVNASFADFNTEAKFAYMIDFDTGTVLYNKRGDEAMPPASMSKLMTAYIIFSKLKNNELNLEDSFTVSTNAWKKGGHKSGSSTMFLIPHQKVKIKDLLRGIIVQSGNDACIVAAENISGSEKYFADLMNEKASEIGLKHSSFKNATGLPEKGHLMSAEDLTHLASVLIRKFPKYYEIYSEKSFTYNKIKQGNRNPLLYANPKADGLKTGHTSASGYGLVASAVDPDNKERRIIFVLNGLKSMKARAVESKRFLSWGLNYFDNYTLLEKGQEIETLPVWLGKTDTVKAIVPQEIKLTLPKSKRSKLKATVTYPSVVEAPIKKGQELGKITFSLPDEEDKTYPIVAKESVERVRYIGKLIFAIKHLLSFLY